jgi:hypothetical protein
MAEKGVEMKMNREVVRTCFPCWGAAAACLVAGWSANANAQSPPVNTMLVGHWDGYGGIYSDVWAEGDYLYGGNFALFDQNPARVYVIDISNPSNPTLANTLFIPAPNNFSSPQDVMMADGYLFVALEGDGNDGVAIYDARTPPNLTLLATVRLTGYSNTHNVFYQNGFLYMCDSQTPRVGIYDMTAFDPDNPPPSPITNARWILTNVGSSFVHEIAAIGDRLYCAAWNSGVQIYDISHVATQMPTFLGAAPGQATHSMWPTADGRFVATGEERANGGVKVFEITPAGGGLLNLTLRDSLILPSDAFSVHNQVVIGNRFYNSWYQAGLQVFDIHPDTGLLTFAASYDTSPLRNSGGFAGCWGVFPLLGDDRIILSDMQEGFFIVKLMAQPFSFAYPDGLIDRVDPVAGAELHVQLIPDEGAPDPSTATLWVAVDDGPFAPYPMTENAGLYIGQIAPPPCGSDVRYYVSASALMSGETLTDPANAPTSSYSAHVANEILTLLSYDFESAVGWSVSGNAAVGAWEAGVPAGDGSRGDPVADYDGSGQCFLTFNGPGDTDVDGGSTTLTSPTLNLTGLEDPVLAYARWYSNSAGATPMTDIFVVEVSNNDGSSWVNLETVGPTGSEVTGGWFVKEFRVTDVLLPTAMFRRPSRRRARAICR